MYVNRVDTKHFHTILPITFLIFNWFSNWKKFWKAEIKSFSTIPLNAIYVDTVDASHQISNAFSVMYVDAVDANGIDSKHLLAHKFLNI